MVRIESKFIKFILVGIINTIFGYSLFFIAVFFGLHYSIASLLSTVIGILFNFKTIGVVVFRENNNLLIFKFIAIYALIYFLNLLFISILNKFVNVYISAAVMLLPLAALSFLLNKKFVFREQK